MGRPGALHSLRLWFNSQLFACIYLSWGKLICVGFRFFTCNMARALSHVQIVVKLNEIMYTGNSEQSLVQNVHLVQR